MFVPTQNEERIKQWKRREERVCASRHIWHTRPGEGWENKQSLSTSVPLCVPTRLCVCVCMLLLNTYWGFILTEDSTESCETEREPPPKPPHTYYNKHKYPDGGESQDSGEIIPHQSVTGNQINEGKLVTTFRAWTVFVLFFYYYFVYL